MKIIKQVVLRTIAGESMLVPVGDTVIQYNGLFIMTPSAKLLWEAIRDGKEGDDLAAVLVDAYGIDQSTAQEDAAAFVGKLKELEIVE